jgi:hypothetical protein
MAMSSTALALGIPHEKNPPIAQCRRGGGWSMRLDGDLPVVGASALGPGLVAPPRGGETRWSGLPPPVGVRLPVGVFLVLKVWKAAVGKSQDR